MYITCNNELMYISLVSIVMTIAGIICIFFPKIFLNLTSISKVRPGGLRLLGIMFFLVAYTQFGNGPPRYLYKHENTIALLEGGKIVKARVTKLQYMRPHGWQIIYSFDAQNPSTDEKKKHLGASFGPAKYYKDLSKGDSVEIIYSPLAPKINCEMRCFLNNPSHRYDFKKAGKLNLLEKFGNKYELEDFTFASWHELLKQK